MKGLALFFFLAATSPVFAQDALELRRGINIHEWLNWAPIEADGSYSKPLYRDVEQWLGRYRDLSDWPGGNEFERIRAMGFDFVRLTVDPGPLLSAAGNDRAEGLAVLSDAVRQATGAGLKVVFDYHLVPQVKAFGQEAIEGPVDAPQLKAFNALLSETAAMLTQIGSDKVAIEPMNEPQYYPCDGRGGDQWQEVMASFVQTIRAVSSDLTIIATGACGGGYYGLLQLEAAAFDDEAILYSVHIYEPHTFTHQGYDDKIGLTGLPWPTSARSLEEVEALSLSAMAEAGLSEEDQHAQWSLLLLTVSQYYEEDRSATQLEQGLTELMAWADQHGIPPQRLFIGEFGVSRFASERGGALDEDRFRYLRAVRELAERFGMGWSMWEYSNPHGMSLINPEGAAIPEPGALEALGLAAR